MNNYNSNTGKSYPLSQSEKLCGIEKHNHRFSRNPILVNDINQFASPEFDFSKLTGSQRLVFLCAALSLLAGSIAMNIQSDGYNDASNNVDDEQKLSLFPKINETENGLVMTSKDSVVGGLLEKVIRAPGIGNSKPSPLATVMNGVLKGAVGLYNEHIDDMVPPTSQEIVNEIAEKEDNLGHQGGISELVAENLLEEQSPVTIKEALINWVDVLAKANNISVNEDGTGILYSTNEKGEVIETQLSEKQVIELSVATAGRLGNLVFQALKPDTSGALVAALAGGWEGISPLPEQQESIRVVGAPVRDVLTFKQVVGVDTRTVINNIENLALTDPNQLTNQYKLVVVELTPAQAQMLNFDPSIGASGTAEPTKVLFISDTVNNYLTPAGSISPDAMEYLSNAVGDDFVNIQKMGFSDEQLYRGLFESGAGLKLNNSDVSVNNMTIIKPDGTTVNINKSDLGVNYNIGNVMEGRSPSRAHGPLIVEVKDAGGNYVGFIRSNAGEINLPKGLAAHQRLRHNILAFLGSPDAVSIQKVVNSSALNNVNVFSQLEAGNTLVPDTSSGLEYKVVSKSSVPGTNNKYLQVVVTTPDGGTVGSVGLIQHNTGRIESYNLSGEQVSLMGKMPATQTSMYTEKMFQNFLASGGSVEVQDSAGNWVRIASQADLDNLLAADADIPIPRVKGSYGNSSSLLKLNQTLQKGGVIMGWAGTGMDVLGYVAMFWQMQEVDKTTINVCGRDNNNNSIKCTGGDIVAGTMTTAMLRNSANLMLPLPQELRTSVVIPHRGFAEIDPSLMQSELAEVITATAQFYKAGGPATGEAIVVNSSETLIPYKMFRTGGGDPSFSYLAPLISAKGVDVVWHITDPNSKELVELPGYIEDSTANPELIGIPINDVEKLPTLSDLGNLDSGINNFVEVRRVVETLDGEEIIVNLIYAGYRDINSGKEIIFIQYDEGFSSALVTDNPSTSELSFKP